MLGVSGEPVKAREPAHQAPPRQKQETVETVALELEQGPVTQRAVGVHGAHGVPALVKAPAPPTAVKQKPVATVEREAEPATSPALGTSGALARAKACAP